MIEADTLKGLISNNNLSGSIAGIRGPTGVGIASIEKTNTVGLIDYYTIKYTDGTTSHFQITNGVQGIQGIQGESGVYIGTEEPIEENINVWIDPNGNPELEANNIYFSDNETLQQKYENGELKGEKGETGAKGDKGEAGTNGVDGYTPVKGDDYFTNEDIASLNIPSNQNIVDLIYPIGSIYMSINETNPSTLFCGTWEQIKDTFLLSAGDTYKAGNKGGEAEHTLTIEEMPSHNHDLSIEGGSSTKWGTKVQQGNTTVDKYAISSNGGGKSHNNMPPYLTVYMWKRIS